MSRMAVSGIIERIVKDKTGKDVSVDIEKLNVRVKNGEILIYFDIPFCDFAFIDFSFIDIAVKRLAIGAYKIFVPKILSEINKKLENLKMKNRRLNIEATNLDFETFELTNANGIKIKGEMKMKSSNLSEFLSGVLTDVISSKAGFDLEIRNIGFDTLNIDVLENGGVSVKLNADFAVDNPGIIGELTVQDGEMRRFLTSKITNVIRNYLNAEVILNVNEMKITAVSSGAFIRLNANAEISDAAVGAIFKAASHN